MLADTWTRTPTRTFTYRQISEASNTIANHLHDAGITNGDVVMIFAHRSVELVCAFMGTLVWLASLPLKLRALTHVDRLLELQ